MQVFVITIAMKQQKNMLLKFSVLFVLFCAVFYAITRLTPSTFTSLNNYTAEMMGFSLRSLGLQPVVHGVFVSAGGFGVEIITECSAIFILILFSSFVLAYPTTFKNKAIGLIFGIPILFAVNTLRLVVGFIAGMWRPDLFEYIHVYLWQTIIIIFVFISCLVWLQLVVMVTTKNKPLTFFVRFIAFSSIPFLIWAYLNKQYVLMTLHISEFLLHCMGYPISLFPDQSVMIYPSTFNLIALTALVLATQSIGKNAKIKALMIGLPLMILLQAIHGAYQVLASYQVPHALEITYAVQIGNQYFLPFGLWLVFVYADVFKRAGTHICPICGEEKVGIVEHIKTKHGEEALEDERVKAMLEAQSQRLRLPDVGIVDYMKKKSEVLLKKKK